jgi:hypothetical protein
VDELDGGRWLVTQLDQFIATFYLPLPEPLGLKNGQHFETYLPPNAESIRLLAESDLDLAYQSLDELSRVLLQGAADRANLPGETQIWFNKFWLSSSMIVHQVAGDPFARSGIDAAMVVASATAGERFELRERFSTLADRPTGIDDFLSQAVNEGMGGVTVIEAAVPLRLIGNLPAVGDFVRHEGYASGNERPDTFIDLWPFIDSGEGEIGITDLVSRLYSALAVAINDIRLIQKAYYAVVRYPVTALTQNRLPHLLPFVLRRLRDIGDAHGSYGGVIETNQNMWPLMSPSALDTKQLSELHIARSQVDTGAFSAYLDLYLDADSALRRQGDTRAAALLMRT